MWEYYTLKVETKGFVGGVLNIEEFNSQLNQLGAQGWELVSCFDTNQSQGVSREVIAVMKRKM